MTIFEGMEARAKRQPEATPDAIQKYRWLKENFRNMPEGELLSRSGFSKEATENLILRTREILVSEGIDPQTATPQEVEQARTKALEEELELSTGKIQGRLNVTLPAGFNNEAEVNAYQQGVAEYLRSHKVITLDPDLPEAAAKQTGRDVAAHRAGMARVYALRGVGTGAGAPPPTPAPAAPTGGGGYRQEKERRGY